MPPLIILAVLIFVLILFGMAVGRLLKDSLPKADE